jgi:hypothetical protein
LIFQLREDAGLPPNYPVIGETEILRQKGIVNPALEIDVFWHTIPVPPSGIISVQASQRDPWLFLSCHFFQDKNL